ncbi:hypothetical protein M422DRAFT_249018 [Sphaerobolus stellatus SS14]|nr:hypothetical protein M422DRAFT_249018 [Sphaerobolus stellatus SS14]
MLIVIFQTHCEKSIDIFGDILHGVNYSQFSCHDYETILSVLRNLQQHFYVKHWDMMGPLTFNSLLKALLWTNRCRISRTIELLDTLIRSVLQQLSTTHAILPWNTVSCDLESDQRYSQSSDEMHNALISIRNSLKTDIYAWLDETQYPKLGLDDPRQLRANMHRFSWEELTMRDKANSQETIGKSQYYLRHRRRVGGGFQPQEKVNVKHPLAAEDEPSYLSHGRGIYEINAFLEFLEETKCELSRLQPNLFSRACVRLRIIEGFRILLSKLRLKWPDWKDIEESPIKYLWNSVYAAKTAAAATVVAILVLNKALRSWLLSYAVVGGLTPIFLSLSPTTAESNTLFIMQVIGSSVGYLWALALLEVRPSFCRMSQDYLTSKKRCFEALEAIPTIRCMVIPYALIMQYFIYVRPRYARFAILSLNGTGIILTTQYIAVQAMHESHFDSPTSETGKALIMLAIGTTLVAIFQLVFLPESALGQLMKQFGVLANHFFDHAKDLFDLSHTMDSLDAMHSSDFQRKLPGFIKADKALARREFMLQARIYKSRGILNSATYETHVIEIFDKNALERILDANQSLLKYRRHLYRQWSSEDIALSRLKCSTALRAYFIGTKKVVLWYLSSIQSYAIGRNPGITAPEDLPFLVQQTQLEEDFIHDCFVLMKRRNFAVTDDEFGEQFAEREAMVLYMTSMLCLINTVNCLKEMLDHDAH